MKKRTDEEKLQIVNDACKLISESLANIAKAKEMLHLCGIELCDSFRSTLFSYDPNSHHAHIYSGIGNLERITSKQARYGTNIIDESTDKSRRIIEHNGVVFLQVGSVKDSNYSYR